MKTNLFLILPNNDKNNILQYELSIPNNMTISLHTYIPINNYLLLRLSIYVLPNLIKSYLTVLFSNNDIQEKEFENFNNYNAYSYPIKSCNIKTNDIEFINDIDLCNNEINNIPIKKNIYNTYINNKHCIYYNIYSSPDIFYEYIYKHNNEENNFIKIESHKNIEYNQTIIKCYCNNPLFTNIDINIMKEFSDSIIEIILDIKKRLL